jgi:transposase InsO family protein
LASPKAHRIRQLERTLGRKSPEIKILKNIVTPTTDGGTQFTSSRFLETLGRRGIIHRRTAGHHPQGNSYIERFHRSLKEEEVWTAQYRSVQEARAAITR